MQKYGGGSVHVQIGEHTLRELAQHGYEWRGLIGKGGFSEVHLVERADGRRFACKISGLGKMAEREAEWLKDLRHPLFPALAAFWCGQESFLVMEYIAGETLEARSRRLGVIEAAEVCRIGLVLAGGLRFLHEEKELLFRDVKPSNIILGDEGRIRLVDAGCICRIGERTTIAGSPGFAAPEQLLAGAVLNESCDVYGLGKTLLYALDRGKHTEKRKDGCAERLDRLLQACTRQEPERRFPDMRSVCRALAGLAGEYTGGMEAQKRKMCGCRPGARGDWEAMLLEGKLSVRKNIWKSQYKNA